MNIQEENTKKKKNYWLFSDIMYDFYSLIWMLLHIKYWQ